MGEDQLLCSSVKVEIECAMPRWHTVDGDKGWRTTASSHAISCIASHDFMHVLYVMT